MEIKDVLGLMLSFGMFVLALLTLIVLLLKSF